MSAEELANIVNTAIDSGKNLSEIPFGVHEKYKEEIVELLESNRKYLGQMDLNIKSPLVYAPKEGGERNFLNEPGTWDLLERVRSWQINIV